MQYNPIPIIRSGLKKMLDIRPGVSVENDPSDRVQEDVSRWITPSRVDEVMVAANGGDPMLQSQLSAEIEEKDHTIADACSTRRNALLGTTVSIDPGDDSALAKKAAADFAAELAACDSEYDSCYALCEGLLGALLPGFSVAEIIYQPGGALDGFRVIEPRHFTFANSRTPRLITTAEPRGIELPHGKFIVHRMQRGGADPSRGGLIRPLAWLACFSNINFKDLESFCERFGMPFIIAKVDHDTYTRELGTLRRLIRNFGPSGGGVFTKSVEFELMQASNQNGEVYFKLLEYLDVAKRRVILGQTATSSDGGGLSADNAQAAVRQDLLEADGKSLGATLTARLAQPWTILNYGPNVAAPIISFDTTPPEDKAALGELVLKLAQAGFECDPEEIGIRVGLKLVRKASLPAAEAPAGAAPQTAEVEDAHTLNLKQKYDAMGVAIRAGLLTATPEIETIVRKELGLPGVSLAVKRAWEATGGIRQPITLKASESAAVEDKLNIDQPKPAAVKALEDDSDEESGDFAALLDKLTAVLAGSADPSTLGGLDLSVFDGDRLEKSILDAGIAAYAAGKAAEADKLGTKL